LAKGEHPYCNSTLKLILSKTTISQSTPLSTSTTNTLNPLVGNLPNRTPRRVMKVPLAVGVLYTLPLHFAVCTCCKNAHKANNMEEAARINELTQALIRVQLEPAEARTVVDKLAEEGYTTIERFSGKNFRKSWDCLPTNSSALTTK